MFFVFARHDISISLPPVSNNFGLNNPLHDLLNNDHTHLYETSILCMIF